MLPVIDTSTNLAINKQFSNADEASATESDTHPDIELIFLGTGTSTSLPQLACLTAPPSKKTCRACLSTLGPEGKKNMRRNTSAVIRVRAGKDGHVKTTTLVIDVGKNFQAAALEWFPKYGLRRIDAVLITHAHADAMNGLDDLRCWTLGGAIQDHIDVYVSQSTFRDIQRAFPYLVAREYASGGGDVPDFKWHIVEDKVPFEITDTGIRITPFSVQHGRLFTSDPQPMLAPTPFPSQPTTPALSGRSSPNQKQADGKNDTKPRPYFCFGFLIMGTIVYVSDVSLIPEDAWEVIESSGKKSVLVIDCLRLMKHTSHLGVREAAAAARRVRATRNYMTGFTHDVSHEEYVTICENAGTNDEGEGKLNRTEQKGIKLMKEGLNGEVHWMRPAHDGLRVLLGWDGRVWDDTYT